mgnify:FL=1
MRSPPYALTRAPEGAALADRQSRIRCALSRTRPLVECDGA